MLVKFMRIEKKARKQTDIGNPRLKKKTNKRERD